MVALKGDKEIGDKINKIIAKLAEANDLKGVIDVADFNDADKLGKGQDMVARLKVLPLRWSRRARSSAWTTFVVSCSRRCWNPL